MPDPITWYALPKKVDDPRTIEEEIDAKILQHNLDPSAHSQSDEALYFHRISQLKPLLMLVARLSFPISKVRLIMFML
jgi:hypothetical protein